MSNEERLLKQLEEAWRVIGALEALIELQGLDAKAMIKAAKEIAKNE
jgi:hypothetical protein